jgi:hypothetical protein
LRLGLYNPFEEAYADATWCRLPFLTTHERIGLTLAGGKKGDMVCLLYGQDVPFILRQADNGQNYKLVGEAYFQDLMEGEVVPALEEGVRVLHII